MEHFGEDTGSSGSGSSAGSMEYEARVLIGMPRRSVLLSSSII
jgi:hypothetical protein